MELKRRSSNIHSVDISERGGVRYLHFGSDWVQGAMRIARPWALELAYTREMMGALLLRPAEQWPRRVLLIGLGAGSQAKFIYRHLPHSRITVVEINPQIEMVARQYFNLPDDPKRLKVVIGDGADYILAGGEEYDLILNDGFDPDARTGLLDTLLFYQACRARLSDKGLLSVNLLSRHRGAQASAERIGEAFAGRSLVFPPCDSGNAVAFGAAGEPVSTSLDAMAQRAGELMESTGLNILSMVTRLQQTNSLPEGKLVL